MRYDVVVVGAGPGGSTAARFAAEAGLKVLLLEKRPEIGAPVRCAEGLSRESLEKVGIKPDKSWIAREVLGARIYGPNMKYVELGAEKAGNEVGYVLERLLFDKHLVALAADAGAEIWLRSPAIGVIMEGGRPVGVKVKRLGEVLEARSDIIIAADGFESQVARWAGIRTVVPLKDVVSTAEFRMANVDIDPDFTEFYLGNEVAPGGYAWIFPKGEREANVGLGVEALRVEGGGAFAYLRKFVEMIPGLRKGQPLAIITGAVSVSLPLKKTYGNGIMLVGDAARLIDPLTGGGIANAMISGMHAGRTAAEAIEEGNTAEEFLARYQGRWKADLWRTLERNYYVKEKLRLMPDKLLSDVFEVLHGKRIEKVGVVPILEEIQAKRPDLVAELEKYL